MEFYVEFPKRIFENNKEMWKQYIENLIPNGVKWNNSKKVSRFCYFDCDKEERFYLISKLDAVGASFQEDKDIQPEDVEEDVEDSWRPEEPEKPEKASWRSEKMEPEKPEKKRSWRID